MVSKNGSKLKFSVESILEPTVTATSKCHPEAINVALSPSSVSIGLGRQLDIMKAAKLSYAAQGIEAAFSPTSAVITFLF